MNAGYELLESLGPAHPSQVSVTVAQAAEREALGIPLAISGDPVPVADPVEREWLRNNPGQPSPFDPDDLAAIALADLERQHVLLRSQLLLKRWIPVVGTTTAPAPAVDAGAVGVDPIRVPNLREDFNGTKQSVSRGCAVDSVEDGLQVFELSVSFSAADLPLRVEVLLHKEGHLKVVDAEIAAAEKTREMREFLGVIHIAAVDKVSRISEALRRIDDASADVSDSERLHNSSPSVGAPGGAVRDNSNPTEGDLNRGGVVL